MPAAPLYPLHLTCLSAMKPGTLHKGGGGGCDTAVPQVTFSIQFDFVFGNYARSATLLLCFVSSIYLPATCYAAASLPRPAVMSSNGRRHTFGRGSVSVISLLVALPK